jgi:PhzF family phenazine biosynthesis protein
MGNTAFVQVDAFTEEAFRGNPAAVFVLEGPADEKWMQDVAREMNLSETAFCHPAGYAAGEWGLRWFTPTTEVDLCGHATLATAHALVSEYGVTGEMGFHTRSGRLTAIQVDDGIRLDFPADDVTRVPVTTEMVTALGIQAVAAGRGLTDLVIELRSASDVRSCLPGLGLLAELADRAVIITAAADVGDTAEVVSRVFGPNTGVPEDPVTGSAHTTLAVWWAPRLGFAFLAEQVSERGGLIHVELIDDRVHLTGSAVTVVRGTLLV